MKAFSIQVVLVGTLYERNVGAVSRAMANMGAHRLILIGKKCELTFAAQQAAATGQEGLQERTEYENWNSFFSAEPDGVRIAFTARDGKGRAARDFAEALKFIKEESPFFQSTVDDAEDESSDKIVPIYCIFGPEDWGLSAQDLELCHVVCCLPTYGPNASLNLAQAVLLALFVLRDQWGGTRTKLDGQQKPKKAQDRDGIFPEQTLRKWLEEMNYDLSSRKTNVFTVLRRMLLHNVPTQKEVRILETVLQQSLRRMKEGRLLGAKNDDE